MKISIIVPAFNEERLLGATLCSINAARTAFERRGWQSELIVCDNNSSDCTAEVARASGARVVFEQINQISRARNRGAAAATGDWLVFVDADSLPSAELFDDVSSQIESGRCLAGGCTIKLEAGRHLFIGGLTRLWNVLSRARRLLAGSFIFCEAAAFRQVRGFSEQLFAGEELELTRRLKALARQSGRQIVVLHRHRLVTSARKARLYSKAELLQFLWRVLQTRGKSLNSREGCFTWYDGRR